MHRSLRRLAACTVIALSLGCSARGGGGNTSPIDGDAATPPADLGAPDDATTAMDRVVPPTDDGVTPVDTGKVPVDLGVPPSDLGVPVDLGAPVICGDGRCSGGETCMSCRQDCGACAGTCGDGTCGGGESCASCTSDCGACPATCGDGSCSGGETCMSCQRDCGACPPVCGDGACNGSESCTSCSADCGACPAGCSTIRSCAACTANPACGWCTSQGACQTGTASGPTETSLCSVFGGWVRSATSCVVDSGVRDVVTPDTGTPNGLTRACVAGDDTEGLDAECGWTLSVVYTCTPGVAVLLGCTGGAPLDGGTCAGRFGQCSGDPVIRVCAGSSGRCTYGGRIPIIAGAGYSEDDACGTCPLGRFACPSSGALTVFTRRYYLDRAASCSIGRLP